MAATGRAQDHDGGADRQAAANAGRCRPAAQDERSRIARKRSSNRTARGHADAANGQPLAPRTARPPRRPVRWHSRPAARRPTARDRRTIARARHASAAPPARREDETNTARPTSEPPVARKCRAARRGPTRAPARCGSARPTSRCSRQATESAAGETRPRPECAFRRNHQPHAAIARKPRLELAVDLLETRIAERLGTAEQAAHPQRRGRQPEQIGQQTQQPGTNKQQRPGERSSRATLRPAARLPAAVAGASEGKKLNRTPRQLRIGRLWANGRGCRGEASVATAAA